jgi:hypothetical protein
VAVLSFFNLYLSLKCLFDAALIEGLAEDSFRGLSHI